jgi:hypothetical protein
MSVNINNISTHQQHVAKDQLFVYIQNKNDHNNTTPDQKYIMVYHKYLSPFYLSSHIVGLSINQLN